MARAQIKTMPKQTEMSTTAFTPESRQQDCAQIAKIGLLDLPQELRDKIYSHLPRPLISKKLKIIYLGPVCCYQRPPAWRVYKRLSAVCKTIRLDVCKIFWAKNVFAINAGPKPPKLSKFTLSLITRLIVRSAPYYIRPFAWPSSWDEPPRFECKLLLRKESDGWNVLFDPEKHTVIPETNGGYSVKLGQADSDPTTPKGALEVYIRWDIERKGKLMVEHAKELLQGDDATVSVDVLAGIFKIFENNALDYMPVQHYNNRLWYLPE